MEEKTVLVISIVSTSLGIILIGWGNPWLGGLNLFLGGVTFGNFIMDNA